MDETEYFMEQIETSVKKCGKVRFRSPNEKLTDDIEKILIKKSYAGEKTVGDGVLKFTLDIKTGENVGLENA